MLPFDCEYIQANCFELRIKALTYSWMHLLNWVQHRELLNVYIFIFFMGDACKKLKEWPCVDLDCYCFVYLYFAYTQILLVGVCLCSSTWVLPFQIYSCKADYESYRLFHYFSLDIYCFFFVFKMKWLHLQQYALFLSVWYSFLIQGPYSQIYLTEAIFYFYCLFTVFFFFFFLLKFWPVLF